MAAPKWGIKKNDMVMVIAGREQGKTGKVLRVLPDNGKATVERLNLVKRHSKPAARPVRAVSWKRKRPRHLQPDVFL